MVRGLIGPFALTKREVDDVVPNASAGAFALGYSSYAGPFIVQYVGRADDLRSRLNELVPTDYRQFTFECYPSVRAAFEKECELYHFLNPADNKAHPDCPAGESWKCPNCAAVQETQRGEQAPDSPLLRPAQLPTGPVSQVQASHRHIRSQP